jgi:hypothetical protein
VLRVLWEHTLTRQREIRELSKKRFQRKGRRGKEGRAADDARERPGELAIGHRLGRGQVEGTGGRVRAMSWATSPPNRRRDPGHELTSDPERCAEAGV